MPIRLQQAIVRLVVAVRQEVLEPVEQVVGAPPPAPEAAQRPAQVAKEHVALVDDAGPEPDEDLERVEGGVGARRRVARHQGRVALKVQELVEGRVGDEAGREADAGEGLHDLDVAARPVRVDVDAVGGAEEGGEDEEEDAGVALAGIFDTASFLIVSPFLFFLVNPLSLFSSSLSLCETIATVPEPWHQLCNNP